MIKTHELDVLTSKFSELFGIKLQNYKTKMITSRTIIFYLEKSKLSKKKLVILRNHS